MNVIPDSIRIEYKAKAVAMRILSKEEAVIFGLLKSRGSMRVIDISLITGITKLKVTKALELFQAVEKCAVDGDTAIFLESSAPAAVETAPAEVVVQEDATEVATAAPAPVAVVENVIESRRKEGRPNSPEEVLDYIKTHLSTKNYSYLNRPDTDMVASANRFFDFYDSKGWRVGQSPMKNWKAAARRAFTDNQADGKLPWGVVKFKGSDMAAHMDAVMQQPPQEVQAVEALPIIPNEVGLMPPDERIHRQEILSRRLTEIMGPYPVQAQFCADSNFGISHDEYQEFQSACARYEEAFRMRLDRAMIQLANVPVEELRNCTI